MNCFKYGPNPASFVYFRPFLNTTTKIGQNFTEKKHRWCAWDSNPGPHMVGANESTELWLLPCCYNCLPELNSNQLIVPTSALIEEIII